MEWCGSPLRWEKNQDPSSTPEQGWQDGAGGLLLVAAVHETGLLTHFESAIASCLTQTSHPQLKRISSRGLTIGLHWPIAPHSPQTSEQGRWFQPVGEIFINKGQTNRSILREKKCCWHRQLP